MAVENNFNFREIYENDFFVAVTKAFKGTGIDNINSNNEENFLKNFIKNNNDLTKVKYFLPKFTENYIKANYEYLKKTTNTSNNLVGKILSATTEFLLIISNVDLTNDNILLGIERIIQGYSVNNSENSVGSTVPFMIVFIGNFVPDTSFNSFKNLSNSFKKLAKILFENQ